MEIGLDYSRIPPEIEAAIKKPHDHEGPNNRPLWLIWKLMISGDGRILETSLDMVADTEENARYGVANRLHLIHGMKARTDYLVVVERVPANHGFASSLGEIERKAQMRYFRQRKV